MWTYDRQTRAIADENGLTVARDVGPADARAILAAQAGDAGQAYEAGYDDGFTDGLGEAAPGLLEAAKEFARVATYDDETDRAEFDPAYAAIKAAIAEAERKAESDR